MESLFNYWFSWRYNSLLATIIKKNWSPITVPTYAMFEEFLLVQFHINMENFMMGVVFNAIVLTISILISVLTFTNPVK